MTHRKLEFIMPARASVVFDAFHYHQWRIYWDSLVSRTQVQDGAPCPSVGVVSQNTGGGLLRGLSMSTRFVAYEPPRLAAATMVGRSFPFSRWAASMRHQELEDDRSMLVYTYTFAVMPSWLSWLLEPVVQRLFLRATVKRFTRLQVFLAAHAEDVREWQKSRADSAPMNPVDSGFGMLDVEAREGQPPRRLDRFDAASLLNSTQPSAPPFGSSAARADQSL